MTRIDARARRALAAAAVVPLLSGALVSCGSDDDATSGARATAGGSSASPTTDPAADPVEETPSAPPEGEEVDPDDFAERVAAAFDDLTTAKVSLSLEGAMDIESSGEVDYRGEDPAMRMSLTGVYGEGSSSELILVDKVMYLQIAGENAPYLKVDLSDPDNPLAGSLGDMSSVDPRKTIQSFTENVESVTDVGSEDIDGSPTTHYVLVADAAALAEQLDADGSTPASMTFDMWLDEQDRPRRIEADLGDQGSLRSDLTDFGAAVEIEAPPASEVQEMPGG